MLRAILLLLIASGLHAQTVSCPLTVGLYGLSGPCVVAQRGSRGGSLAAQWTSDTARVYISRRPSEPPPWRGIFTLQDRQISFEIAVEERAGRPPRLVLRNVWSWVMVQEFRELRPTSGATFGSARLVFGLADHARAGQDDVAILERAESRLDSIATWDRADDRDCSNDAPGSTSLFCLLVSAVEWRMGQYHHRQPMLEIVRAVVVGQWRDRVRDHPLMNFNNDPRTTLADLRTLIRVSLDSARAEAQR